MSYSSMRDRTVMRKPFVKNIEYDIRLELTDNGTVSGYSYKTKGTDGTYSIRNAEVKDLWPKVTSRLVELSRVYDKELKAFAKLVELKDGLEKHCISREEYDMRAPAVQKTFLELRKERLGSARGILGIAHRAKENRDEKEAIVSSLMTTFRYKKVDEQNRNELETRVRDLLIDSKEWDLLHAYSFGGPGFCDQILQATSSDQKKINIRCDFLAGYKSLLKETYEPHEVLTRMPLGDAYITLANEAVKAHKKEINPTFEDFAIKSLGLGVKEGLGNALKKMEANTQGKEFICHESSDPQNIHDLGLDTLRKVKRFKFSNDQSEKDRQAYRLFNLVLEAGHHGFYAGFTKDGRVEGGTIEACIELGRKIKNRDFATECAIKLKDYVNKAKEEMKKRKLESKVFDSEFEIKF